MKPTPPCCKDMADSLAMRNPLIRANAAGLRLVAVGYSRIEGACAWADFPLLFCPCCGAEAQARPEIRALNGSPLGAGRYCCRFRERAAEVCENRTLVDGMIAVGYQSSDAGLSLFEVRVRYCPFCGNAEATG